MGDGSGGVGGAAAKGYEDGGVDENGAEHRNENPKVMEPEALRLIGCIDPALWKG